jgi:hypothetical protein
MYIGKTTRYKTFFDGKYFGSSPSKTQYMRARAKYGADSFFPIVLEFIEGDKDSLNEAEIKWILFARNEKGREMVYNLTDGGDGLPKGYKQSKEAKEKISQGLYRKVKEDKNFGEKRRVTTTEFWKDPDNKKIRSHAISQGNTDSVRLAKSKSKRRISQEDYKFISPVGELFQTPCLSIFCREHGLNISSMSHVHSGRYNQYKGWKKFIVSPQIQQDI